MAQGGSGEEDVVVKFGASVDDLTSKLGQVGSVFDGVSKKFAAMAAVIAGGAAFGKFIDDANKANAEAERVSRTLGITATEAGVLAVALDDIGAKLGTSVSVDTYTSAFQKFNRQLKSGGEELRALGVDVDAVASGQKTGNQAFQEALAIVGQYQAGTDQAQVSMRLFGRSAGDVQALMMLNAEVMDDARRSVRDLNIEITAEGVAAATRYRIAVDNVGDALQAMSRVVGEAVTPMFSELMESVSAFGPALVQGAKAVAQTFVAVWREVSAAVAAVWNTLKTAAASVGDTWSSVFGRDAPGAMEVFKNALRLVQAGAVVFRTAVELAMEGASGAVAALSSSLKTFADIGAAAFNLDWEGVKAAWSAGLSRTAETVKSSMARAVELAKKGAADLKAALVDTADSGTGTAAGQAGLSGSKAAPASAADTASQATASESILKARNDAATALQQEYLRQEQAISDEAFRANLVSLRKYHDDKLEVELAGIDLALAAKRREASEAEALAARLGKQGRDAERLSALAKEASLLGEVAVMEARRAEAIRASAAAFAEAEKKRLDALAAVKAQSENDAAQDAVAEERAKSEQLLALRRVSAEQAFELQKQAETKSFEATKTFLAAKKALLSEGDLQAQLELNTQLENAERQHQAALSSIARAAELERAQASLQAQQGVQQGFAQMANALMSGTTKIKDAVRGLGLSVATTFQNLIAQRFAEKLFGAGSAGGGLIDAVTQPLVSAVDTIVKKWILGQTAMTSATVAGTAARTTAEEAAAGQSIIIMAASAIKRIAIAAWVAAAEVYQALASIPYVGPFLAPAAAIAAAAAVISFGKNIASAEGGWWEIPGDQIAQVHKNEMVLPAKAAQGVRDLVEGGRAGGGGGMTVNISALDGHSVKRVLMDNPSALAAALRNAGRDGVK